MPKHAQHTPDEIALLQKFARLKGLQVCCDFSLLTAVTYAVDRLAETQSSCSCRKTHQPASRQLLSPMKRPDGEEGSWR
jgi:hypothetical protein